MLMRFLVTSLTLPRLWAAAVLVCMFAAVAFTWVYPADFWWHLRYGEEILDGRGLLRTDIFTFTQYGQPFLHQAWLSWLALATTYRLGGVELVVLLNALAFTLAYGLLLQVCRWLAGGSLRVAAAAASVGFALSVENWAVRPQTFSVLLFALTWWLLWRYTLGRGATRSLAWLPVVTGLWANLHGAFVLGLLLQAVFLAGTVASWRFPQVVGRDLPMAAVTTVATGRRAVYLSVALAASAFATLVTPYGIDLYRYVYDVGTSWALHGFILEWGPTTLAAAPGWVFYGSALAAVLLVVTGRRLPPLALLLSLLVFGVLAASALRNVIWFGFPFAFLVAFTVPARLGAQPRAMKHQPAPRVAPLAVAAVLALVVVGSLPWLRPWLPLPLERRGLLAPDTPVAATDALLATGEPGRVFADMQYAGYLLWRLPSGPHLFVDPRVELFSIEQWEDYGTISRGVTPTGLDGHAIDHLLLHKERQRGLARWVRQQRTWWLIYEDRYSALWERR